MVENFIYESGDNKQRCGRQRCKCLRGNGTDSSDDEADSVNCFGESNHTSCPDACDSLKVIRISGCTRILWGSSFLNFVVFCSSFWWLWAEFGTMCLCFWEKPIGWHCENRWKEQNWQAQGPFLQKNCDWWSFNPRLWCFNLRVSLGKILLFPSW